jgi:outer membrane receptor for ferric coprogen and ferric-rhodotorulic acid
MAAEKGALGARATGNGRRAACTAAWLAAAMMGVSGLSTRALAEAGLAVPPPADALAAIERAEADRRIAFDIPAQELNSAILAFADKAGIQVFFDTEKLRGLRTEGVSGTHSVSEALGILLRGTSVTYRFTGTGTVTLERVGAEGSPSGATVLTPISVEGEHHDPAMTEGTGSYTSGYSTVGGKVPTSIRETPQSITVVTRQRLDDQNLTSVGEALDQTTGVYTVQQPDGPNSWFIRGWYGSAIQVDGVQIGNLDNWLFALDTAIYDRVEVLRGPNGMFAGGGSGSNPGGTVNLVPKRALDHFVVQGETQIGSWDFYRVMGDVTGPLVESKKIRGRIVGAFQDNDFFYDVAHERRWVGYGALEADIADNLLLTLRGNYQQDNTVPFNSLPAYADTLIDLPRNTYIGTDWATREGKRGEASAKLEWAFAPDWKATLNGLYVIEDTERYDGWNCGNANPNTQRVNICSYWSKFNRYNIGYDTNVAGTVHVFDLPQKILLGTDFVFNSTRDEEGGDDIIGSQNVFDPDPSSVPEFERRVDSRYRRETQQWGFYGQTRLKPWEPLTFILGGRLTNWAYDNMPSVPASAKQTKYSARNQLTPYAGAVVDVTDTLSVYASYTDMFRPVTNRTHDGQLLPPVTGVQYEAGAKGEFFGGALNTSLAFYRTALQGQPQADPDFPGFFIALAEQRSEGFELEASGSPLPGLQLFAGYNFNVTESVAGNSAGTNFNTVYPRHNFKFWSKYEIEGGTFDGLGFGMGVKAASETFNGPRRQGPYAVIDTQLSYRLTENLAAAINVNNILDRKYYQRVGGTRNNFYGEPRNAMFTLRAKF